MKKIFIIILVISLILNSIPFAPLGKLLAAESNSIEETIVSNNMEGSDEIEYEIESLREPNLKVFKRKDGLIEYNYYEENVHYLEDGIYKEYDVSFNESNSSYSNTVNGYEVVLPKNLKKSNIILRHQEDVLKIKYLSNTSSNSSSKKIKEEKENKKDVITTKSKVEYKNVLKHSIIELIHTPTGLKENIILEKYVKNYSFSYIIETSLKLVNENDTLYFYNDYEKEIFRFNPYNIVDSQNRISYDVELNISITEEGYLVDVIPSDEVLKEFTYPLTIDPVIEYSSSTIASNIKTKYFRKNFNGTTPGIKIEKYVNTFQNADGTFGSEDISTLTIMEINKDIFDNNLNVNTIKFAKLSFNISSITNNNSYDIAVNKITEYYIDNTRWFSYPYENIDGYTEYETQKLGVMERNENVYEFDLLTAFKTTNNNSLILELTAENIPNNEENVILYDSNCSDAGKRPFLTVALLDTIGIVDFLTYHQLSTNNITTYINDCFGNLVLEERNYVSGDSENSLNIMHYFNGKANLSDNQHNIGYGRGISISYLERLREGEFSKYYYIIDSTGRRKYYKKSEVLTTGVKYISEEGDDEYIIIDSSENEAERISVKIIADKYRFKYDNDGYLFEIVEIVEKDENEEDDEENIIRISYLANKYNNNKLIDEIRDSSDNVAKFFYDDNLLSEIRIYKSKKIQNQDEQLILLCFETYEYDLLKRLVETKHYTNETKLLSSEKYYYKENTTLIEKIEEYNSRILKTTLNFEYDDEKVVKYSIRQQENKINEKDLNVYIEYQDGTTTFTDDLGQKIKYLFDYFGHTQTIIDNYGNIIYYKYTDYNEEIFKKHPNYVLKHQVEYVSNPINLGYNLIQNHSFENGDNNWNISGGEIVNISAYGQRSLKALLTEQTENTIIANQSVTIKNNQTYKIRALIQGKGDILITSNEDDVTIYQNNLTEITEGYFLYEKEFIVSSSTKNNAEIYVNLVTGEAGDSSEYVYFDQIMLDKYNIDTIYNLISNSSFEESNSWNGGTRILRDSDQDIFGDYELKLLSNSAANQIIENVCISSNMSITLAGFINTKGSNVKLRVAFMNSNTGESSDFYTMYFIPYLTDYQFKLCEFTIPNIGTLTYDVISIDIINEGGYDCYVDNLILTSELSTVKYEYNELGYQTKKKTLSDELIIEYADDKRTISAITMNNNELRINETESQINFSYNDINIINNINADNKITQTKINDTVIKNVRYEYGDEYIITETGTNNKETIYSYDYLHGLLSSVMYEEIQIQYNYDDYLRLMEKAYTSGKIRYEYDSYDNISKVSVIDSLGMTQLNYYFEYNNHNDITEIYIGVDGNKTRLIKYEYLYSPLSDGNNIYTGLISKVYKTIFDDIYERYEYDEEYNLYKIYEKKMYQEEQLISEFVYDSSKNISLYKSYNEEKTYRYNYDFKNRLVSCLDEKGDGVLYIYDDGQNSTVEMQYIENQVIITSMIYEYIDGELERILTENTQIHPAATIDNLKRTTSKIISTLDDQEIIKYEMNYHPLDNYMGAGLLKEFKIYYKNDEIKYTYEYDMYGNIYSITTEINDVEVELRRYNYNDKQELIRERIDREGRTVLLTDYQYNVIGNIEKLTRSQKQDEFSELPYEIEFFYVNNFSTKLNYYRVKETESSSYITYNITYDEFGNIRHDGKNLFIYDIDKLINIQNDNNNIIYDYNSYGVRIYKKIINLDDTYEEVHYDVSGDIILKETRYDSSTNTTTYIIYIYDESGVVGFKVGTDINNLTTYYFVKNLQNDIIQIIDTNENVVVEYTYDAYGNVFISGTLSNTIGKLNPYRYRGYYYDEETQLYWVSSRYYSPELCRWISPDSIEYLDPESVNGLNLYCYCANDPINKYDPTGHFPWLILAAALLFTPAGGTASQVATSVSSYAGMAVASIFDKDIRNDMNAIGWNPFNTDESATLNSSKVSFYKGVPVFRIAAGGRSGSFGAIFLTKGSGVDTLRHERGHNWQLMMMGIANYGLMILLPSWREWSNRPYYERPWEITADVFGGVTGRTHSQADINRGYWYLGVSSLLGPLGYFFLFGEY